MTIMNFTDKRSNDTLKRKEEPLSAKKNNSLCSLLIRLIKRGVAHESNYFCRSSL